MKLTNLITTLNKMTEVLKREKKIILFTDGTRTKTGEIDSFKKTFAIFSREFNIPIVPVNINETYEVCPCGTHFPGPWKK